MNKLFIRVFLNNVNESLSVQKNFVFLQQNFKNDKNMKYFAYEFWPGMEIQVDRRYTSFVVAIVPEMQPSGEELNLIVYKDWNPGKKIWDYHIDREISLSWLMKEYKGYALDDFDWAKEIDPEMKKKIEDDYIEGPDGTKPLLDKEHMTEVYNKYKIVKTWEDGTVQ